VTTRLSEAEKTDVRRFCGYPAIGGPRDGAGGWLYFQQSGLLEYRMNNLSDAETIVVRRYLATLLALELEIPRSSHNLDTDQAAVWTRNRSEARDRAELFDGWRRRLCEFLGVTPGRGLHGGAVPLVI